MRQNNIPLSRRDAIRWLRRVARMGLRDPLRIDMNVWVSRKRWGSPESDIDEYDEYCRVREWPKYGVVGCVGGWIEQFWLEKHSNSPICNARVILGLTNKEWIELFYNEAMNRGTLPQTPQHARAAARHIERFNAIRRT